MGNYYECVVKYGSTRSTVVVCTDMTFPRQYNKSKREQYGELIELAFDEVVASANKIGHCIDRDHLRFVYYKKTTKEQLEYELKWFLLEEQLLDEMEDEEDEYFDDWYDH